MPRDDDPQELLLTDLHAYRWEDGVEVELERFKEGSDSFTAQMTVLHRARPSDEDSELVYGPVRITLTAPQTIATTAKTLAREHAEVSEEQWKARLKHMVYASWKAYQEGSSRLLWADEIEVSDDPYDLVPGLVAGSGVSLVYGDGAAGKSTFAVALGLAVCTGIPTLGVKPAGRGPVIYFDWEDGEAVFRERVGALCAAYGIAVPHTFGYRQVDRSVLANEARIRREVEEHEAVMAIFDSVGEMVGGDPSDTELTITAINIMKRIGAPAVGIHHLSTEQAESTDLNKKARPFGSRYARNGSRMLTLLERFQEEEADEGIVFAHNMKVNRGKKRRRLSWTVEYENSGDPPLLHLLRYSTRPADDYFDRLRAQAPEESLTISDAIVRFLKDAGGMKYTYEGLTAGVNRLRQADSPVQSVANKANALVKRGVLSRFEDGGKVFIGLHSDREEVDF